MKFARRKTLHDVVELNITAFMNLMVILVPFLLITAVFSRMTVIELNLPALDTAEQQSTQKLDLALELVIREKSIDIQDQNLGQLYSLARMGNEKDWKELTRVLLEIKSRYPEEKDMMLLFEPGITYKTLIKVMDQVKSTEVVELTELIPVELFPNISISDAPILELSSSPSDIPPSNNTTPGDSK